MMTLFNRVFGRVAASRGSTMNRFEKPLTGLFVTVGLAMAVPYLPTQAAEARVEPVQTHLSQATAGSNASLRSLPNGVYLYGQSAEPDQMGSAYMVFAVNNSQVVGAFYMPYSSFDCFNGEFQPDRLALNIVDSYDQSVHPYSVALDRQSSVASATGETAVPAGLEGFHRISAVSENDQRILATCQADYQHQSN
ncbi:MAG TPA: hypothetical protein V6C78_26995 [Crinalium sp.]